MTRSTVHHLSFTLPQALTAADLPALAAELFRVHDLDPVAIRQPRGLHGYRERYSFRSDTGAELVCILLNGVGTVHNTSHVIIHGAAWDAGAIDPQHVCRYVMDRHGWGSRVDLARDDLDGILPWAIIRDMSLSPRWSDSITTTITRPRLDPKTGEQVGNPTLTTSATGSTLYFGLRQSDTAVAIYDRRGPLRVEYRTTARAAATDIIRRIAAGEVVGEITAAVLMGCLRFHTGTGRKDRRPVASWWLDFLGSAEPVKLPRHRPSGHKSPWYVPPTRAAKVVRYVRRNLDGTPSDTTVIDALRDIVTDTDLARAVDHAWKSAM